ncbi:CIC11C00000000258 [Sungouiella intermedia]|uniref:Exocyst complex component SEC5 n=1 Tax=Sungouiella intermedia TaxID=45354 RepID=A0A1L0G8M5_9ASCO|nr:CIC11C00000000258 [[Candida] intermedia]
MLNYDDNEQTLAEFYHVDSLEDPGDYSGHSKGFQDSELLDEMTLLDRYDTLSKFLKPDAAVTPHHHTEEDFRDPLNGDDLAATLIRKGAISSENDPQVNKFMVSSQAFNSQAYLLVVHQDTSIEQLITSLNGLDRSIRGQTSQLKSVLNENFDGFVSCKTAIDNVLETFKALKSRAQQDLERSKVFNPALRKNQRKFEEGESLLAELDESINNLNMSTSLMIRPIMDHNAKEAKVTRLIEFVNKNKFLFDLPHKFIEYLSAHDHDSFIDDYNNYLKEREFIEGRQKSELERAEATNDSDEIRRVKQDQAIQNTALEKVFTEVENIASEYRKKAFKELLAMDHEVSAKLNKKVALDVKFIDLVNKLHRLNNNSENTNPIFHFLSSQLDRIRSDLYSQRTKFETKFALMQRRLMDYISSLADLREGGSYIRYIDDKFESVESYFRASSTMRTPKIDSDKEKIICEIFGNSENLDLSIINEAWLVFSNYITYVHDIFHSMVAKFVKNYNHYANGQNGYNVDPDGVLRDAFFSFINSEVTSLVGVFDSESAVDQMRVTPTNCPYLPYHTNSLSTIFYLTDISRKIRELLTFIGQCTVKVGNSTQSMDTNRQIKSLRDAAGIIDQKILEGVCATWVNDCSQFYDLENWEQYEPMGTKNRGATVFTKLMRILHFYEIFVLEELAKLVFETPKENEEVRVVASFPSKRVLVSLEIQFMRSMNVLVDSIVKQYAAEKSAIDADNLYEHDIEQIIFKILTMNNFTVLGENIYPHIIEKFDKLFEKTLLKQNLKLFADLDKVKLTILDDINENEKAWIDARIEEHFRLVENKEIRTLQIDSFVYDSLMRFVRLVHVFKPIADPETFVMIILELQGQFLLKFLLCIRAISEKEKLIARVLGNLKLDLDFFVEVFERSDSIKLDDHCLNIVQITLGHIEQVEKIFSDLGFSQSDIDNTLARALRNSEIEFSCFV